MALINCPECKKEISDKAPSCPNCGVPLIQETFAEYDGPKMPAFPDPLDFGRKRINWFGENALLGSLLGDFDMDEIEPGWVIVRKYQYGLKIMQNFKAKISIHNLQIISINGEAITSNGAFVTTSTGFQAHSTRRYFLTLEYWDLNTEAPRTLDIECNNKFKLKKFVARLRKERKSPYDTAV